ncbi:MAG: hypothetical protein U9R68_01555 [Planctomycetota bacterium]|nr:hypothetical protein [Planctomycetota bacterium]
MTMHMLAFWMPGPWELVICAILAVGGLGAVAAIVVVVVLLAGRKGESAPPEAASVQETSVPSGETPPADADSPG